MRSIKITLVTNMKNYKRFRIFVAVQTFLIIFLFSGCFPTKVIRLTPMNTPEIKGMKMNNDLNSDSCGVNLRYNGISYGFLDFSMTVRNHSSDTLITGPEFCSYIPIYSSTDSNALTYPRLYKCIIPDERVAFLKEEKVRLENEKNPYTSLSGILISAISQAIASDKQKSAEETRKNAEAWETEHLQAINNIYRQIDFWRTETLGRVILTPRQDTTGRILFPFEERAVSISVLVRVSGKTKTAFFRQEITEK